MSFPNRIEIAIANFAGDYVVAANELNPFLDGEAMTLGEGVAVYTGQLSPIHGVIAFGLSGPIEPRDLEEIDKFFLQNERAADFFVSEETDPSLLEYLEKNYQKKFSEKVYLCECKKFSDLETGTNSTPDHGVWALLFARSETKNPERKTPDLFSTTMMHLRNTRFYTLGQTAGYSYFHQKIALCLRQEMPDEELLEGQIMQAKAFGCEAFALVVRNENATPLSKNLQYLYTRTCYAPKGKES